MKKIKFSEKYGRRIKASYAAVLSVFLFTCLLSFAVSQNALAKEYRRTIGDGYVRAFSDLISDVENIKYDLAKCVVTRDPVEISKLAAEIYRESASGSASLSQLPLYDTSLAGTAKFLNQVGDFTNSLSLRSAAGGAVSDAEYETLLSFQRYAETLYETLSVMQGKLFGGEISFLSENGNISSETAALTGGFEEMEAGFDDYPSLIYDGPFSDHIENTQPALLEGLCEITKEEAQARIKSILGFDLTFGGESGGNLPAYYFYGECKNGAPVSAEITKRGGMLSWYLCDRTPGETAISADGAKAAAHSYISLLGLSGMRDTYYEIQNGIALINFAATDGGVILYPDLVKVRVALDTGEVIGSELHGYIMNHKKRQFPSFSHSESEIYEKISRGVSVSSVNRCLIPTKSGGEVFCYEVHCGFDNHDFLVYLNAETLRQEDILILLTSENGTLTV